MHDDPQYFQTTQWSTVLSARNIDSPENAAALERLCRAYWHPLYFFARRRGSSPEDAQDSVQGFFEKLLAKDYLQAVTPEKGRFKTFLLTAFTHYLANEWDSRSRLKRGGGAIQIRLDALEAEERYLLEPVDLLSPEKLYDRGWAETVVNLVLERLRAELSRDGEADRFELLRPYVLGQGSDEKYAALGEKLGLSEGGVKTLVRRFRLRFAAGLRKELASTLADSGGVEAELRHLLEALMG